MNSRKHALLITAVLVAGGLGLSACATEDYVNQQVGAVKTQVDALNAKVDGNSSQIQALNGQVQDSTKNAQDVVARIQAHETGQGFAHQVLSTDNSTNFETAKWSLSSEDQTALTAFAQKLVSDNQDVYVEIHGHGDLRGSTQYNQALGLKRAEATRHYLAEQGVPLHRMSVISYGEASPISTNETAQGQSENRRVTLVVVAH